MRNGRRTVQAPSRRTHARTRTGGGGTQEAFGSQPPEVFVGRQPIFDRRQRVVGYELLFRDGKADRAVVVDHEAAIATVVLNSITEIGFEEVVGDRAAWINVSSAFLRQGLVQLLPPGPLVLEILEDQTIDDEILEIVKSWGASDISSRSTISCTPPTPNAKKTGDGKNPSCVIVDEAAQIVDRNAIEVLHSGMVARQNPLRIYITTASFTKDTKFYEDMSMLESMLNGEASDNPRWFGLLYALDPQDDWRNPKTWAKANPMHGISVFEEAIAQRAEEAKNKPAALNEFLCKTLNIYVSAQTAWVDRGNWDKPECNSAIPEKEPEAVFIGFDLAATRDLNAVCTLKRYGELDYHAHWKFFLPEAGYELIPKHYQDIFRVAVDSGILKLTEGNVMDDREISDYIKMECEKYNVKEVGYDAYNAASLVARLYDAGIPVKKVGQGMAVLSNPSKYVEKLILNQQIKHDGNPFVGWQLSNCEVYEDVNGNIKVRKNEADKAAKVDGIIAYNYCIALQFR